MNDHAFCRILLRSARDEARQLGLAIPKNLTALLESTGQYFVEMDGRQGEFFSADCAYEAKAKFIAALISAAALQSTKEEEN